MNVRVLVISAAFAALHLSVLSQSAKIEWSETVKTDNNYIGTVSDQKDGFVALSYISDSRRFTNQVDNLVIRHFDKKLKLLSEKKIKLTQAETVVPVLFTVKGKCFLLTSDIGSEFSVFITPVNLNSDQPDKTTPLLHIAAPSKFANQKPRIYYSADSGKVLVSQQYVRKKGEPQRFAEAVIDESGTIIWQKDFEIPVTGEDPNLYPVYNKYAVRWALSNTSEAFLVYPTEQAHRFNLLSISAKGVISNDKMDIEADHLIDAALTMNSAQQLFYSGLYRNDEEMLAGYFTVVIDPATHKLISFKSKSFNPELLATLYEENHIKASRNNKGVADLFHIRSTLFTPNGSVYTMAEYNNITNAGYSSSFEIGDILIMEYQSSGKLQALRIPKYQPSTDGSVYSSYFAMTLNNKLFVFYNDCVNNLESPDLLVRCGGWRLGDLSASAMAIVEEGKLTRKIIFRMPDYGLAPLPQKFYQLSANQIGLGGLVYKGLSKPNEAVGVITIH